MAVSNAVRAKAAINWDSVADSGKDFLATTKPDQKFQLERHGYFVADRADHGVGGNVVFNRVTGLEDSWDK